MVPTPTRKPGKMREHFSVREKTGNFEQTGKVREFCTKYWKKISSQNTGKIGNFRQFLFLLVNFNLTVK